MPLYEYKSVGPGCPVCSKVFELRRPVNRAELTKCPVCKQPIQKLVSEVNSPRLHRPMALSEARQAGFKVYKKRDQGVYEKL